jgi:hypothetical protein
VTIGLTNSPRKEPGSGWSRPLRSDSRSSCTGKLRIPAGPADFSANISRLRVLHFQQLHCVLNPAAWGVWGWEPLSAWSAKPEDAVASGWVARTQRDFRSEDGKRDAQVLPAVPGRVAQGWGHRRARSSSALQLGVVSVRAVGAVAELGFTGERLRLQQDSPPHKGGEDGGGRGGVPASLPPPGSIYARLGATL